MRGKLGLLCLSLLAMFAVASGDCGTTNPPPPPGFTSSTPATPSSAVGDVSGTWKGSYTGAANGTFTLTWTQSGSTLSGTIDLSTGGTSDINGTVSGTSIEFGTVGSSAVTYDGIVNDAGDQMAGQYKIGPTPGGTWKAQKTS